MRKRYSAIVSRADADAAVKERYCIIRTVRFEQYSSRAQRWRTSVALVMKIRLFAVSRRRDTWHVRVNRAVKLRVNPSGIARGPIVPAILRATRLVPFQCFFFTSSHAGNVNRFWWFAHAFIHTDIISGLTVGSGHSANFGTNPTGTPVRSTAPSTSSAITSGAAA